MTSQNKLKKELVAKYLDFSKEFFDVVGMPDKERKKHANKLFAYAESNAADASEGAVRATFNSGLLDEGKVMLHSLATAFAHAASQSSNGGWLSPAATGSQNGRLDIEAHGQPQRHNVPSRQDTPRY